MQICYVDESGCTGVLPSATSPIQPVFVLGGIIIDQRRVRRLTQDLLGLKSRFYPKLLPVGGQFLDWMLVEIKGSTVRKQVLSAKRDLRRHAFGFMDKLVDCLVYHEARITGKLFVKGIGFPFNGTSVYTSSVQALSTHFQQYLEDVNDRGVLILDSRTKSKNSNVSHSVFTQKYRAGGDRLDRLEEMPVFGHSDNHAGLQAADLLCSAFLFPMACYAYCLGHVSNMHVHMGYMQIRDRYGDRLREMQHRYQDANGRWTGGIIVNDSIGGQSGAVLFRG